MSLVPDYIYTEFDKVTPDFLLSAGIRGVVLDIDNTLEPYENPKPGERVLAWLAALDSAGIKYSVVSNNDKERVNLFLDGIDIPAYFKAGKPFKKNIVKAMRDMGTGKTDTIMIGDQIFTDVWAARNAGIRAILVPPIKDKRDVFTRFKRLLEKPIIRKYYRSREDK